MIMKKFLNFLCNVLGYSTIISGISYASYSLCINFGAIGAIILCTLEILTLLTILWIVITNDCDGCDY